MRSTSLPLSKLESKSEARITTGDYAQRDRQAEVTDQMFCLKAKHGYIDVALSFALSYPKYTLIPIFLGRHATSVVVKHVSGMGVQHCRYGCHALPGQLFADKMTFRLALR